MCMIESCTFLIRGLLVLQAEKTKKREETAAVCIVQVVQPPSQESKFLLVRRPKDGLLAGTAVLATLLLFCAWRLRLLYISHKHTLKAKGPKLRCRLVGISLFAGGGGQFASREPEGN